MRDENTPLNGLEPPSDAASAPELLPDEAPPKRPEYTKKQRIIALLGAIFVIAVTLMYTYSLATGDLFFR